MNRFIYFMDLFCYAKYILFFEHEGEKKEETHVRKIFQIK